MNQSNPETLSIKQLWQDLFFLFIFFDQLPSHTQNCGIS